MDWLLQAAALSWVLMSLAPVSLWQEVVEVIIGGNNSISD
jgi:hypothetical protein